MVLELPDLPYVLDALSPHLNAKTLALHHGKHHQAYVTKANELIDGSEFAEMDLVDIIKATAGKADHAALFNNAAQAWNHTFYWHSMKPEGGGVPTGAIAAKIATDLGGYENFKESFSRAGTTQFGSGWAWLTLRGGRLEVTQTPDAENPLASGAVPLLTMDVWEHAYYLDFQNRRSDYVKTFLQHLVNWDFVNQNLTSA